MWGKSACDSCRNATGASARHLFHSIAQTFDRLRPFAKWAQQITCAHRGTNDRIDATVAAFWPVKPCVASANSFGSWSAATAAFV